MMYEIKLDGVYWDILFYEHGIKKLRAILTASHPDKIIRIITRGRV